MTRKRKNKPQGYIPQEEMVTSPSRRHPNRGSTLRRPGTSGTNTLRAVIDQDISLPVEQAETIDTEVIVNNQPSDAEAVVHSTFETGSKDITNIQEKSPHSNVSVDSPSSPDEENVTITTHADVYQSNDGDRAVQHTSQANIEGLSNAAEKPHNSEIESVDNSLNKITTVQSSNETSPPGTPVRVETDVPIRPTSVTKTKSKNYRTGWCCLYQPFIWFIIVTIVCYFYVMWKNSVDIQTGENIQPEIEFNINRVTCIEEDQESTSDCLFQNNTAFLNQSTIRECRTSLVNVFRHVCFMKKTKRSRPFPLGNAGQNSQTGRPFPVLKEDLIFKDLKKSENISETVARVKYTTCLRTFQKNPLADVKVTRENSSQYNFIYKNYNLLRECNNRNGYNISDLPFQWYFQDPKNYNDFVKWNSGLSLMIVSFLYVLRFIFFNEECCQAKTEPQSPSKHLEKKESIDEGKRKKILVSFRSIVSFFFCVDNCGRSVCCGGSRRLNSESRSSRRQPNDPNTGDSKV